MSPQITDQLDPQPFRDWVDARIRPQSRAEALGADAAVRTVEQVARELGLGDRRLWRWRNEVASLERIEVEEALHLAGVGFWEVYPDLEETTAERTHGYCTGCREDVPVDPELGCLFCGKRTWRRRSGVDMSAHSKLTDDQLRALYRLNQKGVTVRELGRRIWKATGYSSFMSAEGGIRRGFRRLGLQTTGVYDYESPLRRCRGVRPSGKPCGSWPMVDSDYCMQHDPDRREDVRTQAIVAAEASKRVRAAA